MNDLHVCNSFLKITTKTKFNHQKQIKMNLLLELGIVAGILLLILLISFANKINQKSER